MNKENNKTIIYNIFIVLLIIMALLTFIASGNLIIKQNNNFNNNQDSGNNQSDIIEELETNDFSFDFLKLENNKQNKIYSPLSIKYALKMLSEGASGNTKMQIDNVISKQTLTQYNNIDKVLSFANAIYIRDIYSKNIREEYIKILTENYNVEVKYDSFINANNINDWIETKTLGIIKNMLDDKSVQNPDSKLLLINALAIDMEWEVPFRPENTSSNKFYLEDGTIMEATTMNMLDTSDNISYYKDDNVTALAMGLKKYDDVELEFVAIMPETDLTNYINTFSVDKYSDIMKQLTLASNTDGGLDISIPRFSFDYDLDLKQDLIKLGINDAFDSILANFSKMADTKFYVGDALHKANIDFSEKGIKAGAATVIIMKENSILMQYEPIEIDINKPFLYIIRDKNTNEIWFVGSVYEPNHWRNDKQNYIVV